MDDERLFVLIEHRHIVNVGYFSCLGRFFDLICRDSMS